MRNCLYSFRSASVMRSMGNSISGVAKWIVLYASETACRRSASQRALALRHGTCSACRAALPSSDGRSSGSLPVSQAVKRAPWREHEHAGQGLSRRLLLDLAGRADQLADEGVGQEDEAILRRVVGRKMVRMYWKSSASARLRPLARVGVEDAAKADGRVGVDDEIVDERAVQADLAQGRDEALDLSPR